MLNAAERKVSSGLQEERLAPRSADAQSDGKKSRLLYTVSTYSHRSRHHQRRSNCGIYAWIKATLVEVVMDIYHGQMTHILAYESTWNGEHFPERGSQRRMELAVRICVLLK